MSMAMLSYCIYQGADPSRAEDRAAKTIVREGSCGCIVEVIAKTSIFGYGLGTSPL